VIRPGVPTALAVAATGTSSLRATWTAPTTGGPVRNYRVRYRGGRRRAAYATVNSDETALEITGLQSGTTYDVSVRAENIGGNSTYTAAVQGATN